MASADQPQPEPELRIYCDESGGIGRGVMTLAAVAIEEDEAVRLLDRFRQVTGLASELKGSRIDLAERALFFQLFEDAEATATVGIAISALRPALGEDRGDHDRDVYMALVEDVLGAVLPESGGCLEVVMDDGRYDAPSQVKIRADIGRIIAPLGLASLGLSHNQAGLQIADVVANSFFNRALVSDRQARIAAMVQPLLDSGRIRMRVLGGVAQAQA